jgi:hypothetical protein
LIEDQKAKDNMQNASPTMQEEEKKGQSADFQDKNSEPLKHHPDKDRDQMIDIGIQAHPSSEMNIPLTII